MIAWEILGIQQSDDVCFPTGKANPINQVVRASMMEEALFVG